MKLKSAVLRNFRRFTDLQISALPDSAKLIVLCGPNGTGKSSFFDALRSYQSLRGGLHSYNNDLLYYPKVGAPPSDGDYRHGIMLEFYTAEPPHGSDGMRKLFYLRTAYRNDPDFVTNGIGRAGSAFEEARPARSIENDATVSVNYTRLVSNTLETLYAVSKEDRTSAFDLRERIIGEIRDVVRAIYPDLVLSGLGSPLDNGSFYFSKGTAQNFIYKNLSAGEKAVFDLILDLVVKRRYYDDTIWCIDEPETHLNTRVQGAVLRELVKLVPDNSQLILATHSIGFMREAWKLSQEAPGKVVFLDFQDKSFDETVELTPVEVTRDFWRRTLEVALGDLADLVSPKVVVLCEGKPVAGRPSRNTEFDAKCYRAIFSDDLPDVEFISVGNSEDVTADKVGLGQSIQLLTPGSTILRVTDRDLKNDAEVAELEKTAGVRVLSRRNIESYLLDDEVIEKYCASVNQTGQAASVVRERDRLLADAVQNRGIDPDDRKSIAGELYTFMRRNLSVTGGGSTWSAFASSSLAPLLRPGMKVYGELKDSIFRS
jgi:hypothetical protein